MGLGQSQVSGRSRVPSPPAMMIAFITNLRFHLSGDLCHTIYALFCPELYGFMQMKNEKGRMHDFGFAEKFSGYGTPRGCGGAELPRIAPQKGCKFHLQPFCGARGPAALPPGPNGEKN